MIYNIFIENEIDDESVDWGRFLKKLKLKLKNMLSIEEIYKNSCIHGEKISSLSFDVVLTTNEEIKRINREYRGKDAVTDVISFAIYADSPKEERFIIDNDAALGEIIVSLEKAQEQADSAGHPLEDEVMELILHGILHLLGFDHKTEQDYEFVVKIQKKVLN